MCKLSCREPSSVLDLAWRSYLVGIEPIALIQKQEHSTQMCRGGLCAKKLQIAQGPSQTSGMGAVSLL